MYWSKRKCKSIPSLSLGRWKNSLTLSITSHLNGYCSEVQIAYYTVRCPYKHSCRALLGHELVRWKLHANLITSVPADDMHALALHDQTGITAGAEPSARTTQQTSPHHLFFLETGSTLAHVPDTPPSVRAVSSVTARWVFHASVANFRARTALLVRQPLNISMLTSPILFSFFLVILVPFESMRKSSWATGRESQVEMRARHVCFVFLKHFRIETRNYIEVLYFAKKQ